MSVPEQIVVVNVESTAYSGSTWVNLVLGTHSQMFSVCELDHIARVGRPLCDLHGESCPLWSRIDPAADENIYLQIARAGGKRVLLVNNTRRFREAQDDPAIDARWLFVARDGRAVVASTLRKYPDRSTWRVARRWSRTIRRKQRFVDRQGPQDRWKVRYEDLNARPEDYFLGICRFLGLEYEPSMLEFWRGDHHPLGGNGGPVAEVARYQGLPFEVRARKDGSETVRSVDWEHYAKADPAKFKDERWKRELTPGQLRVFSLLAGRLNRRLGYEKRG